VDWLVQYGVAEHQLTAKTGGSADVTFELR